REALGPSAEVRVPLRHRLPNPPPVFVGRENDVAWVERALDRGTLAVLCGVGGIGKTALALDVLHRAVRRRSPRVAVRIALRGGAPGEAPADARIEIVRVLSRLRADTHVEWSSVLADREALSAAAIDFAEAAGAWVLLDDAHHGDPALLD